MSLPLELLPLSAKRIHIGESAHRHVDSMGNLVVKYEKDTRRMLPCDESKARIKTGCERARTLVATHHGSSHQIPRQESIIYGSDAEHTFVMDVQRNYPDAQPLAVYGLRLFGMSEKVLCEWRELLMTQLRLKNIGISLDLAGSDGQQRGIIGKYLRRLFAPLTATNMVHDAASDEVILVDANLFGPEDSRLIWKLEQVGTYVALLAIDTTLFLRRLRS